MANQAVSASGSIFRDRGFKPVIESLVREIQELYKEDQIPWVVGYSGGKDSTAVLQLVWLAIAELPAEERIKPIHVVTTDTLVENPIVAAWVELSQRRIGEAAEAQGLPIYPHLLKPQVRDTFWVNLIGRGYPAPRHKMRWCTERLKIKPADAFIQEVVKSNGEAIVVLGVRKAESSGRHSRIKEAEKASTRDKLYPHASLVNSYIYGPIRDWSNDDVWMFLMQTSNPWGHNNKELLTMYQGASADGECPLVIDTSTPSCGDSRFGCWVCTLVEKDKSMSAMIQNDEEKEWLAPLLRLRNELDEHDHDKRDFRRMAGHVQLFDQGEPRPIPGPYVQSIREEWLRKLLQAQQEIRDNAKTPETVREIELITLEELDEIRRIWVLEKHEVEDSLPGIYEEITGAKFPGRQLQISQPYGREEMQILRETCGEDFLAYQLIRELLEVERGFRGMAKRAKLFERLERAFQKSFYENESDAVDRAVGRRKLKQTLASFKDGDDAAVERLLKLTDPSDNGSRRTLSSEPHSSEEVGQ